MNDIPDVARDIFGQLWINGFMVEQTGICNCDGGEFGHRQYCGFEPIGPVGLDGNLVQGRPVT